ncbi:hypothetical protein CYMTET_24687 [Cymbomonas tetramitiformis]|uniref:Uncharacterized protein n=1 Tax=Cymbomonas tetramitiformis TaxID=36881 RepID=A0AAE0FVE2_9CHLO|nr:hypothetical protein CYMTET_24687 [Cymbomonas tetramitiformis]
MGCLSERPLRGCLFEGVPLELPWGGRVSALLRGCLYEGKCLQGAYEGGAVAAPHNKAVLGTVPASSRVGCPYAVQRQLRCGLTGQHRVGCWSSSGVGYKGCSGVGCWGKFGVGCYGSSGVA